MVASSIFHPVWFFAIVMFAALIQCPLAFYLSSHKKLEKLQFPLMFLSLSIPCITALVMIFTSSHALQTNFWERLLLFKIHLPYLLFILFLMPGAIYLATWISLFFGFSAEQFSVTQDMRVMKGWAILGIAIPLVLAPLIEELGWRGYGVDSLRAYFNLFNTFVLFGFLLGNVAFTNVIKGYYQNTLWNLGIVYVLNFFVSVFVMAILMNWVFSQDRSQHSPLWFFFTRF